MDHHQEQLKKKKKVLEEIRSLHFIVRPRNFNNDKMYAKPQKSASELAWSSRKPTTCELVRHTGTTYGYGWFKHPLNDRMSIKQCFSMGGVADFWNDPFYQSLPSHSDMDELARCTQEYSASFHPENLYRVQKSWRRQRCFRPVNRNESNASWHTINKIPSRVYWTNLRFCNCLSWFYNGKKENFHCKHQKPILEKLTRLAIKKMAEQSQHYLPDLAQNKIASYL